MLSTRSTSAVSYCPGVGPAYPTTIAGPWGSLPRVEAERPEALHEQPAVGGLSRHRLLRSPGGQREQTLQAGGEPRHLATGELVRDDLLQPPATRR